MNVTDLDMLLHLRSLLTAAALNGEALNKSLSRVRNLIRQRFGADCLGPVDDELLRTGFDLAAVRNIVADAAILARALSENQQQNGREGAAEPKKSVSDAVDLAHALRKEDRS